ncbi:hypothetical protein FHS10_003044 [Mucilaginibacter dorajii]|nr:hypothetical protein [Mucilaginibacter dorajii]MCS3735092.1 hypothetical protein [Mucilaginibacter dorajii]
MLKKIYAKDANWRELTRRLPKAGQRAGAEYAVGVIGAKQTQS